MSSFEFDTKMASARALRSNSRLRYSLNSKILTSTLRPASVHICATASTSLAVLEPPACRSHDSDRLALGSGFFDEGFRLGEIVGIGFGFRIEAEIGRRQKLSLTDRGVVSRTVRSRDLPCRWRNSEPGVPACPWSCRLDRRQDHDGLFQRRRRLWPSGPGW